MARFALLADSRQDGLAKITLATSSRLLKECANHEIIDTGCTSSVCGAVSFDMFIRTLPADLTAETMDQIHKIYLLTWEDKLLSFRLKFRVL